MHDCKPDVVAVTETWFTTVDSAAKIEATPIGYKLLDHPRPNRTGGGTGISYFVIHFKLKSLRQMI